MYETIHPARTIPFDDLVAGLEAAAARGHVYRRVHAKTGLEVWCYTTSCIYDDAWDEFTLVARGLVLDRAGRRVVATPLPKFFNVGEKRGHVPDEPFEAFEKIDGSLAVVYEHAGRWWATTKGGWISSPAAWAQARLDASDTSPLVPGTTYCLECTWPGNRIVVRYDDEATTLLAAYAEDGRELSNAEIEDVAGRMGWPVAERTAFSSMADLVEAVGTLTREKEGFVLRFASGLRLKAKGAGYRRVHSLVFGCTPLSIWEMMREGDDLDAIRREVPEELWGDFDDIRRLLDERLADRRRALSEAAASVAHVADRDLQPLLKSFPKDIAAYLFAYRRQGIDHPNLRDKLMLLVRPMDNVLDGYVPSSSMERIAEELKGG